MIFFLARTEQQHYFFLSTGNDSSSSSSPLDSSGRADASRPSIAVVIGVLSTMFSITFLLLIYAKHCRRAAPLQSRITSSSTASSGVDPLIISALPMFSFSSLKGHKGGLECAVCLCSYQEADILRLLPSCKHAFHVQCVDQWLLARPTCPLCRTKVSPEDTLLIDASCRPNSNSVEEQLPEDPISARFQVQVDEEDCSKLSSSSSSSGDLILSRLSHRIIITDVVFQQRWSDLVPADVLFLNATRINGPNINHANARMPLSSSSPDSNLKARLSASCLHKGSSSCSPPLHHNSEAAQQRQQQQQLCENNKKPPPSFFLKRALSVDQCSGRRSIG